jgi:hypothetical protein
LRSTGANAVPPAQRRADRAISGGRRDSSPSGRHPPGTRRAAPGEALVHFALYVCATRGLICYAARTGREASFARTDQWLRAPATPGRSLGVAGRTGPRYLRCYGRARSRTSASGRFPAAAATMWRLVGDELRADLAGEPPGCTSATRRVRGAARPEGADSAAPRRLPRPARPRDLLPDPRFGGASGGPPSPAPSFPPGASSAPGAPGRQAGGWR